MDISHTTLHVTGFQKSMRARDLAYHFEKLGPLVRCDIPMPKHADARAFAFVEYEDERDAAVALQRFQGVSFGDNCLQVEYAKCRRTRDDSRREDSPRQETRSDQRRDLYSGNGHSRDERQSRYDHHRDGRDRQDDGPREEERGVRHTSSKIRGRDDGGHDRHSSDWRHNSVRERSRSPTRRPEQRNRSSTIAAPWIHPDRAQQAPREGDYGRTGGQSNWDQGQDRRFRSHERNIVEPHSRQPDWHSSGSRGSTFHRDHTDSRGYKGSTRGGSRSGRDARAADPMEIDGWTSKPSNSYVQDRANWPTKADSDSRVTSTDGWGARPDVVRPGHGWDTSADA